MVVDYNHIETVEIVGDGYVFKIGAKINTAEINLPKIINIFLCRCIHLNLKFEHSKSIKISPVQNFWRTLQYLPTWSNQSHHSDQNTSGQHLRKSKSYVGLISKEFNLLNTASLVNSYYSMLTENSRITFLWHNNDYHTSELLGDTVMEM